MKKVIAVLCALEFFAGTQLVFAETHQVETNPDRLFLQQAISDKYEALRGSARGAYSGILLYPKDVRDSVLEVAQYPDLVIDLSEAKGAVPADISKYPAQAQEAAKILAPQKKTVAIMKDNLVMTALLGEVVKENKEKVVQAVDRLSQSVEKENDESTKAWAAMLARNPDALKQLQTAGAAYAKANNQPDPNQPVTPDQVTNVTNIYNQYGYYVQPNGQVVVYDMFSQEVMSYTVANAAMFTLLVAIIYDNHEHYYGGYYWHAYDDYWTHNDYEDYWNSKVDVIDDDLKAIEGQLEEINNHIDNAKEKIDDKRQDWQNRKDDLAPKVDQAKEKWNSDQAVQNREAVKQRVESSPRDINAFTDSNRNNASYQPASREQRIGSASDMHANAWAGSRGSSSFNRGGSYGGGSMSRGGGGGRSGGGGRRR